MGGLRFNVGPQGAGSQAPPVISTASQRQQIGQQAQGRRDQSEAMRQQARNLKTSIEAQLKLKTLDFQNRRELAKVNGELQQAIARDQREFSGDQAEKDRMFRSHLADIQERATQRRHDAEQSGRKRLTDAQEDANTLRQRGIDDANRVAQRVREAKRVQDAAELKIRGDEARNKATTLQNTAKRLELQDKLDREKRRLEGVERDTQSTLRRGAEQDIDSLIGTVNRDTDKLESTFLNKDNSRLVHKTTQDLESYNPFSILDTEEIVRIDRDEVDRAIARIRGVNPAKVEQFRQNLQRFESELRADFGDKFRGFFRVGTPKQGGFTRF